MLAGWSLGGYLAVGYAICHPEKVEKVLAFSPARTVSKLSKKFMMKLLPALITGKVKYINKFLKWISENDNEDYPNPGFMIFTKGMQSFSGWARGTSIKAYSDNDFISLQVPCKIVIGDKDG